MKLTALSDTHERHHRIDIPLEGDVLVFAGDATMTGSMNAFKDFAQWMGRQHFDHKVMIAGNHDHCLDDRRRDEAKKLLRENSITYLRDSSTVIDGVKFYGAPWTPTLDKWGFQLEGEKLREKWEKVPADTNVLITHGPAHGTGDYLDGYGHIGDEHLRDALERIQPDLHIYGHVHERHGKQAYGSYNVTVLDGDYDIAREKAYVIEVNT